MKKEKTIKIIKKAVILLLISIVLEVLIMGYTFVIRKYFKSKHLIGNDTIELSKDKFEISEVDEWGYKYLSYNEIISNVYNIELVMKEKNEDAYLRVIFNNDAKLMNKYDEKQKIFKAYFDNTTLNGFKFAFTENQIDVNNIEKILINDNLDYVKEVKFEIQNVLIFLVILYFINFIIYIIKKIEQKDINIKKEKVFLITALVIGTIFCFINLVFTKYDEHSHFWRAYELSTGHIISGKKNIIPESVFDVIINKDGVYEIEGKASYSKTIENLKKDLDTSKKSERMVGAAATYSPFNYLPQIVGITIGRVLKLNPVIIGMLGRFTNLLAYVLLIYFSIKLLPKEKWKNILMCVALLPMSIDLAASMSPDTVIISTSIFLVSYILNVKFKKEKVSYKDALIIGIFTMIPSICKVVYLPFLLLPLLIPKEKYGNKKQMIIKWLIIILITLIPIGIWNMIPNKNIEIAIRTSTTEQLYFTLSDPMRDLYTAENTLWNETGEYIKTMVGGWNTPMLTTFLFLFILLLETFKEDSEEDSNYKLSKKDYIVLNVINIIISLLIFAGLYVGWTRAQFTIVEGVQGRYFLPILFTSLLVIEKNLFKNKIKNSELKVIIVLCLLYIPVIVNTIQYFNK